MYRDEGPVVGGRGTPRVVTNFNMKNSADYATAYFPTQESASAPLVRKINSPGDETLSYKVYTFFKLEGTYNVIKNFKIKLSVVSPKQASKAKLYYKMTNVYEVPDNSYDGDMMLAADGDSIIVPVIYPNISTIGPHEATSPQLEAYSNVSPLYTAYIVTQIRVGNDSTVGNTSEYKLRFECKEYGFF
jgi:hypothetical protein